jgi:Zn-finger nucleic acid-binding protein
MSIAKDTVDKCPQCAGLWFNREELGDIEELPNTELMNDFQDQLNDSSPIKSEAGVKDRLCPLCRKPMDSYQYDLSSGVWIQACPDGEGVWLDKGEVFKIHDHLVAGAKSFPKEKLEALYAQLKVMENQESRQKETEVMSVFERAHDEGSGGMIPVWHLMDGGRRLCYHFLSTLGAV